MRKEVKPQPEEPKIIEDKSKEISPAKNNTLSNKNVFNIGAIATVSAIATTADEGVKKEMIQLKEELRIEKEKHNNDNQLYESKLKQKDKDHKKCYNILQAQNQKCCICKCRVMIYNLMGNLRTKRLNCNHNQT